MKWLKYGLMGIVGVVLLAAVVLLAMGQRADAGVTRSVVEVNRPPEVVWKWMEEPEKFKQWVSWTVKVEDSGPNGVGGKRRTTMKDPNMDNQLVVLDAVTKVYEPHKRIQVAMDSPLGFQGTVDYELDDLGGRTRLTMVGKFRYTHWFFSLLEPLVTPQAQVKEDADLATLKRLAEL
ncbi:MAG: SRPBCC family protein [Bryobacterales bacterium]|nr:SRPBCC family protein [Bryobacterales bacterium]